MKNKCKIVMLSSEKASNIILLKHQQYKSKLIYNIDLVEKFISGDLLYNDELPQHLYVLSDERVIKNDTWVLFRDNEILNLQEFDGTTIGFRDQCKKIIATTNSELFYYEGNDIRGREYDKQYQLSKISEEFTKEFIHEYNNGNVITEVMVEYEIIPEGYEKGKVDYNYKIKLNSNNTIIINRIKKTKYTREFLESACYESYKEGIKQGTNKSTESFESWFNEIYPKL